MAMTDNWAFEDDDGNEAQLVLTTTHEGFVLDVFDHNGECVLTEAMMVDEWVHWMRERDKERRHARR